MAAVHQTAYPRLKSNLNTEELSKFYTPTLDEKIFAEKNTRTPESCLGLLTHLKVFQNLGYFVLWKDIPPFIPILISNCMGSIFELDPPENYDESGSRIRHLNKIREFMKITAFGKQAVSCLEKAGQNAVQSKEHLPDIINVMIEELIRRRFELPGFSTLERAAYQIRYQFNESCFQKIGGSLSETQISKIEYLLESPEQGNPSAWNLLKQEPNKPTIGTVKSYAEHIESLLNRTELLSIKIELPAAKYEQFCNEAYAADLGSVNKLAEKRRYTYAVLLVQHQTRKAVDNLSELLIRQVGKLHTKGKQKLERFRKNRQGETEVLIEQLLHLTQAFQIVGSPKQRFVAIEAKMDGKAEAIEDLCTQHLAYAQNNYFLFLPGLYKSKRAACFACLALLKLESAIKDQGFKQCVEFILTHRYGRKPILQTEELDLKWIPERWRKPVTGTSTKQDTVEKVNSRFFELCVFTELARQLRSGDMYLTNSYDFDDYRKLFISWKAYHEEIKNYETLSGIPTEGEKFIRKLKNRITRTALSLDAGFNENEHLRIEDDSLIVSPTGSNEVDEGYQFLDTQFKAQIQHRGILDVLTHTEKWLNLSDDFGLLSGYQSRIENYPARFVSTLFCYGCNFGPSEAARSIPGVNRKQLARINAKHITEKRLDKAIEKVINRYNEFQLPSHWGSGKTAAADGTKWNLYEQNLISEYHIRYGAYGGIAYYHVSDTYIALFSHFIPCGVYEALYVLDGLIKNTSDIQPDTIHGDTHAQSFPVFGLAYLLGIRLMPRIKRTKSLILYHPGTETNFSVIGDVFGENIKWDLIEKHLPEMLRVALSVKAGKITPSAILRRLGTHSRKNKLYYAFRELGRAVRTGFLLEYYQDFNLRKNIHAATVKCEEFNHFAKWTAFVNNGKIRENLKHEQIKVIKYNHLVANLLILYNTHEMTRVINQLKEEGHQINPDTLKQLSPYRTEHINRFGSYAINMEQDIPPLSTDLKILD